MFNIAKLAFDLIRSPKPEQMLYGYDLFRPFLKYQTAWLQYCYQEKTLNHKISAWQYLQTYLMPMIKANASSYHLQGIHLLNLDAKVAPDFDEFKNLFYRISNGFSIQEVDDEINPLEYYSLIQQKKFPCIRRLRSHSELFCAGEPDFWHEAIGHIAPLCFQEVQAFYQQIASYMLSAKDESEFENHLAIAWTLTEYGFLKENNENKMFGAALVGSHLAQMRYMKGVIAVEAANRASIIDSGFYEEHSSSRRDQEGRLRFFCLDHLDASPLFIA